MPEYVTIYAEDLSTRVQSVSESGSITWKKLLNFDLYIYIMRNFLNTFRMSDHWLLQKGVTSDPKKGETLWQSKKALQMPD